MRHLPHRYLPHTAQDIERMLRVIGVASTDALFDSIPPALRFRRELDLPAPLCEPELLDHLEHLGRANRPAGRARPVFCGAGISRHYIPAAVHALSMRGEFATAYTPYQAELSQGTLTAIFEFQTITAELFGTEYANASMYDGASAAAEAMLMARRLTGRVRTLYGEGLHPEYAQTCRTYASGLDAKSTISTVPLDRHGATDVSALLDRLGAHASGSANSDVACVIVQSPNFLGVVEDLAPLAKAAHEVGALLVAVCAEPLALALMRAPGEAGADIVVGEGLGLASPPSLGGPGVGLFGASGKNALRQMPGRLVGETVDESGRPGYVLTLSTREQHIRREKATSNICTNQGLLALRFAIHVALLGRQGFSQLARLNLAKAAYAQQLICDIPGYARRFDGPIFNEFAVRVPGGDAEAIVQRAAERGIVPGVALGRFQREYTDTLLVSVTELSRRDEIDRLVDTLRG